MVVIGLSLETRTNTIFMAEVPQCNFCWLVESIYIRNGSFFLNGSASSIGSAWPSEMAIISLRTTGNVEASNFSNDRNVGGGYANADLAELLIYNKALTDLEIRLVEGYTSCSKVGACRKSSAASSV